MVGLNFGRRLLHWSYQRDEFKGCMQLVGICDLDKRLVEASAIEFSCKAYASLNDVLADETVEAVLLMTGPTGRASLIRQIVRAGKDVMTTKPFESDAKAAEAVLAEARELNRFVYLNAPSPVLTEDLRIIQNWRDTHQLGRPVAAHYECWYKQTEQSDGSWYDDPERCFLAPILRLGIYGICDISRILGEPKSVQVMESRLLTGRPTSDLAKVQMAFDSGALADLTAGWVTTPDRAESSLSLYFENGTIHRNPINLPSDGIKWHGLDMTYLTLSTAACVDGMPLETIRIPNHQTSRAYQWRAFARAVVTRQRPTDETPDAVIVNSVRTLEALKRAADSQRTETTRPLEPIS